MLLISQLIGASLGFALFTYLVNSLLSRLESIEYRERTDGTVYRVDGQDCWWSK